MTGERRREDKVGGGGVSGEGDLAGGEVNGGGGPEEEAAREAQLGRATGRNATTATNPAARAHRAGYMGVEAGGGCGGRAVVTGFYVWGWEFLTALLLFSATTSY